jgi:hypothetical protein
MKSTKASRPTAAPFDFADQNLHTLHGRLGVIRTRVGAVIRKYATGLFIAGRPGTGKSYTVYETLNKAEVAYHTLKGGTSPLGLMDALGKYPNHVIVLDDVAGLFKKDHAKTILMAATDGKATEPRTVTYNSRNRGEETVLFAGGIIVITNVPLRDDPHSAAFRSRVDAISHEPSDEEIRAYLETLVEDAHDDGLTKAERKVTLAFLVKECRDIGKRLDLRDFHKAMADRRLDKVGLAEVGWQTLIRSNLHKPETEGAKADRKAEKFRRFAEALAAHPASPRRQVDAIAEAGYSRSDYYRWKQKEQGQVTAA